MAAKNGHFDIVQCLVFKGCDVFVKSKHGTALDVAQKNDHQLIVTFLQPLLDNHQNPQKKYFRACAKGDLQEVKYCLKEIKTESRRESLGNKAKESKSAEVERKALAAGLFTSWQFVCLHLVSCLFTITFLPDGTEKDEGKPTNKKDIVFYDRDGKKGKILKSAGLFTIFFVYILSAVYLLFFQMEQQRMKASLPT